ncbi:MAG TPA: ergothioneine biosynthesis protein EgtB [Rhizomicrobium sp.]
MNVPSARLQVVGRPVASSRGEIATRYLAVRAETERLAAQLTGEDQSVQSMPDASPTKWHRAHTTWFFETFVLCHAKDYRPFDSRFGFLFNSYYEAAGPRHARPLRGLLTRPDANDVRAYRQHVDGCILALLDRRGEEPEIATLTALGLEHEQQHQELILTDILHAFAQNPLLPAYTPYVPAVAQPRSAVAFAAFDGGIIEIGHTGDGFSFDNENPPHEVLLNPFRLADRLVTNGEWLEFIAGGGYETASHWLSDGWLLARQEQWESPLYWQRRDDLWHAMTLSGLQPVDPDAPVCNVSYYEADAFTRWRGKRLPTECEWEHAARFTKAQPAEGNLRESGYLRPLSPRSGSMQLFGDTWEWTQSPYTAYPEFRASQDALGEYNGKFMINQMVLRGGSCLTNTDHVRAGYRNFFHPHQRWQFSGLRLADDLPRRHRRPAPTIPPFLEDVWRGLSATPKNLPSKYFYDAEGSRLFEAICNLPEYYLTRSESDLLGVVARELSAELEPNTALVEFGCGACTKTRVLLDLLPGISSYVPIDICEESLKSSVEPLIAAFPHLDIRPLAGDFAEDIVLPQNVQRSPRLGFFSGSTIGNFEIGEATDFLRRARRSLGTGGKFLVAIDLAKDVGTLLAAYDDAQGVTAKFNANLLARINRELGASFDLAGFSHLARWNTALSRIEMHLLSREDQTVRVAGREFRFPRGETIHTENSHKYTIEQFAGISREAGWTLVRSWSCPPPEFALVLLA